MINFHILESSRKKELLCFVLLLFIGIFLRLILAFHIPIANDIDAWKKFSTYWENGLSPYDESHRYNYTPLWFVIISACSWLSSVVHIPFEILIRFPLILSDVATTLLLLKMAKFSDSRNSLNALIPSAVFFLNPVSVLITGVYGQFDTICLFFLLLAIYFHEYSVKPSYGRSLAALTSSVLVKHFAVLCVPAFAFSQKKNWKRLLPFILVPTAFVLIFIPFASSHHWIFKNVLQYNLHGGYWGWSGIICRTVLALTHYDIILQPWFKYIDYFNLFMYSAIFFISYYAAKRATVLDSILLIFLFFYVFTTQIAPQYSIWVVALGSLRRNRWYYAYTLIAGAQLALFYYCHYHWWHNKPFVGFFGNHASELFVLFRHLTWLVCVFWFGAVIKFFLSSSPTAPLRTK